MPGYNVSLGGVVRRFHFAGSDFSRNVLEIQVLIDG
ncbi:hypothetical protein JMJ77_0009304, partial [Colletotrichum scovillei]